MIERVAIWLIAGMALVTFSAAAQDEPSQTQGREWLKVYRQKDGLKKVSLHHIGEIDSLYYTGKDGEPLALNIASGADGSVFSMPVDSITEISFGSTIPTLYIDTEPYVDEIPSKEEYMNAVLRYVPYGDGTDSLRSEVLVKGRGNSSWSFPKKPYRLKFEKKQELGGLKKAKSFVLISNYIDNTLMRNAVAFKIAELVGLPYTNRFIPVNVVFNGMYQGSYLLTNKVGINAGSVDIDEKEGILWELDMTYDEEFKFKDAAFNLPQMVKDPDLNEITGYDAELTAALWKEWQDDLNGAMMAVKEGRWTEAFDAQQMVKYLLVQALVQNREMYYGRSIFFYKENKTEKYKMGPVWDFDMAFGYDTTIKDGELGGGSWAAKFFDKIYADPEFIAMMEEEYNEFRDNHLEELTSFIDEYRDVISDSALIDSEIWPEEHLYEDFEGDRPRHPARFEENVEWLKNWILKRVETIKTPDGFMFY